MEDPNAMACHLDAKHDPARAVTGFHETSMWSDKYHIVWSNKDLYSTEMALDLHLGPCNVWGNNHLPTQNRSHNSAFWDMVSHPLCLSNGIWRWN